MRMARYTVYRVDETQQSRNSLPRLHFGFQLGICRGVVCDRVKFYAEHRLCFNPFLFQIWLIEFFTDPEYTAAVFSTAIHCHNCNKKGHYVRPINRESRSCCVKAFYGRKEFGTSPIPSSKNIINLIERFHETSRRPCCCSKTKKRRPNWCTKTILRELNLYFYAVNHYGCLSYECTRSIKRQPLSVVFFTLNDRRKRQHT